MPVSADRVGVAIPIRGFDGAKSRLAAVMTPAERRTAARAWATVVLGAAGAHARFVVTDDDDVAAWATGVGAAVVAPGRTGLDAAADAGRRRIFDEGLAVAVIAHGDLPLARSLDAVIPRGEEIVLVPDRHRDGTTVIALPRDADFAFSYGPGSFGRHLAAAAASGRPLRTVEGTPLGIDVDEPDDLALLS